MKTIFIKDYKVIPTAVLLSVIVLISANINAQAPTVQDCLGAIPVCQDIYYEPNVYNGTGNYPNEIYVCPPSNCTNCCPNSCMDGEQNSVWYIFTIQQAGLLSFSIIPDVSVDDYDWAVYDLSLNRCEDIYTNALTMQSSCNAAGGGGYQGSTGVSSSLGGTSDCNNCGPTNKWNADLPVLNGRTYVLCVSNWMGAGANGGFTLDFSASTAVIYDDVRPELAMVHAWELTCGDSTLRFVFTEKVMCSSITASSLEFTGPGGPYSITNLSGVACELGAEMEKIFTIKIDPPFSVNGNYSLNINPFSSIRDACGNIALPQQYPFTVDLGAPEIVENNMIISNSSCGQSNGSITDIEIIGTPPYTYEWVDGGGAIVGTELDLIDMTAGMYTLTVRDENTCESIGGPYQINDDGAPEIDETNIVLTDNTCGLDNGSVTDLEVAGFTNLTFEWIDDIGNIVGDTLDLTNVPGGIYFLKVTDENQCESFAGPYTIEDFPAPILDDVNAIVSGANCENSNGFIINIIAAGSTDLTFEWTNEIGTVVGNNLDLTGMPAGFYTLSVTDENQCISVTGPYEIEDIAGPQIDDTNADISNPVCWDTNGYIAGITATGNSGLTYEWTNILGNIVGEEVELVNVGPGTYTLKVTDEALCQSLTEPYDLVNVGGSFIDEVEILDTYCELSNGSIEIAVSGGYDNIQYSIDNGNSWQGNNMFSNISPGIYNIWIRDEIDCITLYSGNPVVIENYGEQIIAQASSNTPVCEGDDLQMICDIDNASYLWEGPNSFISTVQNPVINNVNLSDAGTYSVKVTTSPYNCSDSVLTDVEVLVSYAVEISITVSENPIYPGYSVVFTAIAQNPGSNPVYEWMIDGTIVQSGSSNTFTTSSIYKDQIVTCRLIPSEPCSTPNPAFSNEIMMKVQVTVFYLPNSFNPNSVHGNNEFKVITSSTNIPGFTMYIYNKWGQLIFKTNDLNEGWDGMVKGKPAPKDVYVWLVKYTDYSESESAGNIVDKKGTVTLVR